MKKMVVFNGVSSSGKTTLAKILAEKLEGTQFFDEIGGALRKNVSYNVLQPIRDFDKEVMKRELLRDTEVIRCEKTPMVETWHLGNMAYILTRNPSLFSIYAKILKQKLEVFQPFAVLVNINSETFRHRIREKLEVTNMEQIEEFYRLIFKNTCTLYDSFRIDYKIIDNNGEISNSVQEIMEAVKFALR